MPAWINAFDRLPVKSGNYHVKVNGRKEVYRLEEFNRGLDRYDSFEWLDENIQTKTLNTIQENPENNNSLIHAVKDGQLKSNHYSELLNLFGIKSFNKIKKRIKR